MQKLSAARKACVRRTDAGVLVPDAPRLFAEWEAIDVSGCPADFCAAWGDVFEAFRRAAFAARPMDTPAADPVKVFQSPAAAVLESLTAGRRKDPSAATAVADLDRATDGLRRVLKRYGLE